ncbi:MAG TPA: hypothetical protein PKE26_09260 [Kiritimatiellia bacterium]|nr:hypothetical protein [Kiritimatiellia bacterium]HMP95614.1 hypothetical protein [Kiritimatiellia bacterium]
MHAFSRLFLCLVLIGSAARAEENPSQPASVIQTLIDAASPGDEVLVPAGRFTGVLTLKDGVIVRGAGDALTVLDGEGAAEVVAFGKESALIGFTIRNGAVLVSGKGYFIGLFECTLEDYRGFGIQLNGGSGVIAHNILRGNRHNTGLLCAAANPLIVNNLIEDHHIGVQLLPHLIPSLVGNLFRSNHIAIAGTAEAQAIIERNLFDGNGTASALGELPPGNEVRAVAADEFVLQRGVSTEAYRALMMEVYHAAVKDHPIIVYDLHPAPGSFDAIGLFPWANFTLSASAIDTRIEHHEAYDVVADRRLNSEYFVQGDNRPSVRVHNPELIEKMRERYVLENIYIHAPSYFEEPDGRRIFRRMTNVSQIEVVIPAGYRVVSATPAAVVHAGGDRTYLTMEDIGVTHVEVIMERATLR